MKTEAELRIERLTLGLVLLVVALGLFDFVEGTGWVALALGVILLGSALYQRAQDWSVGVLTWVIGAITLAIGLTELLGGFLVNLAAAFAVLLIGLWLVGRGFGMEI